MKQVKINFNVPIALYSAITECKKTNGYKVADICRRGIELFLNECNSPEKLDALKTWKDRIDKLTETDTDYPNIRRIPKSELFALTVAHIYIKGANEPLIGKRIDTTNKDCLTLYERNPVYGNVSHIAWGSITAFSIFKYR